MLLIPELVSARRFAAAALLLAASALDGHAAETVLWTIGKVDASTLEFNSKWDFSAQGDPVFTVGRSDPKAAWSAFHPGPRDPEYGSKTHPFTVSFELTRAPAGVYRLQIDLLFKSAGVPQYIVDINGKQGRFFPQPKLSDEIGDPETAWNIVFSRQRLELDFPASYLHTGTNRLVLTCVGDASEPLLGPTKPSGAESGVYYDALQLSNDPEAKPSDVTEIGADPTIFYRHGGAGLRESVLVKASAMRRLGNGSATLTLAGHPYTCNLDSDYDFGEAACTVEVDEFQGSAPAQLSVHMAFGPISKELKLTAARKWKLFLAPQMHLDMGYTDFRPNSYEVHARNIDEIVDLLEKHPDFKFNPDGAFIWSDYWEHRTAARRERALAVLRENRLTLPAQLFTVNTGLTTQEELFRLFYDSAGFAKSHGVAIHYANQTDVPAHVWAVPSYLKSIGIRYFAISSNPFRGAIIPNGHVNAKSPFWWEGPDGSRVLTWFSKQYQQFEGLFTKNNSEAAGVNSLPVYLQTYSAKQYLPDAVLIYGTQSDNRPFLANELDFPAQWNKDFAYPSIRMATMDEFFAYVDRNYGKSLSTISGDGGAWWEEMTAANAWFAAQARRTKQRALAAETLASLATSINPDIRYPVEIADRIWRNLLLYTEHTWGASRAWGRPQHEETIVLQRDKELFTEDAANETDDMLRRAMSQIGSKLNLRGPALVVYNSLSWPRSGEIEVDVERGRGLVDLETGKPIALELVRRVSDESYDRVRFRAENVPALGYRSYGIVPAGSPYQPPALQTVNTIESRYYRITVDAGRGGISGIYDKTLGRELVDTNSPYALDQYVYAGYGHDNDTLIQQRTTWNTSLLQISPALPRPRIPVTTARQGRITTVQKTLWGSRLVMVSSAPHAPAIQTEIRLFDNDRKIAIWNHVRKEDVQAPEGVYFAFPFALAPARIRYESQNAWIDPEKDQLPGANKEWFAAQNWVSVSGPGVSVGLTLDEAPLLTIGDIDRGLWPKTLAVRNGTVFSYVMDNYDGDDERPTQGGEYDFHYTITSEPGFRPEHLARFAREETRPLESDRTDEADKLVWPREPLPVVAGFLEIDNEQVILAAWKGAQDGRGTIARFYNTGGSPATATVRFPHLQFKQAYWASPVENDERPAEVSGGVLSVSLKPHEIRTVRLVGLVLGTQN